MASRGHQNHPVMSLLYLSFQVFMNILSVQTTFYVWGLRDKLSLGMEFLCLLPQLGNVNYTGDRQPHGSLYEKNFLFNVFTLFLK